MRATSALIFLPLFLCPIARAEPPALVSQTEPVIVWRDAHTRTLQTVTEFRTSYGRSIFRTNHVTEMQTGLCRKDSPDGPWVDSGETVSILTKGISAVATQGQHRVTFAADITVEAPIDITWNGQRLRLRPTALAYTDRRSGESVTFAETKQAVATTVQGNKVVWEKCWDGADASLSCVYTRAGLTLLVTFHSQPITPAEAGLDNARPEDVLLQIFHQVVEAPAAFIGRHVKWSVDEAARAQFAQPEVTDDYIDFAPTCFIGPGAAFAVNAVPEPPAVPIAKTMGDSADGKRWIVESCVFSEIDVLLRTLPEGQAAIKRSRTEYLVQAISPGIRSGQMLAAKAATKDKLENAGATVRSQTDYAARWKMSDAALQVAQAPAVSLDLIILGSGTNNYTFEGTTLISGLVTLSGTNTLANGCVIRFANTNSAEIRITGSGAKLISLGTPWLPCLLTAIDDQSVGEVITTNSAPSGYYATCALHFDYNSSGVLSILSNVVIRFATAGIRYAGGSGNALYHSRVYGCQTAFEATGSGAQRLRNVVALQNETIFGGGDGYANFHGENLTLHLAANLVPAAFAPTLRFTNTIVVGVTNYSTNYTGANNRNTNNTADVFDRVGNAYYLKSNSPWRDVSQTALEGTLADELKARTTFAPTRLTNDILSATNLGQQVALDTGYIDLGFHPERIDWLIGANSQGLTVSNAVVTTTNGAVVAIDSSITNWGIRLHSGAAVSSIGWATNLNRFLWSHAVDEIPSGPSLRPPLVADVYPYPGDTVARFKFTDFPVIDSSYVLHQENYRGTLNTVAFSHCQFDRVTFIALPLSTAMSRHSRIIFWNEQSSQYWPMLRQKLIFTTTPSFEAA